MDSESELRRRVMAEQTRRLAEESKRIAEQSKQSVEKVVKDLVDKSDQPPDGRSPAATQSKDLPAGKTVDDRQRRD